MIGLNCNLITAHYVLRRFGLNLAAKREAGESPARSRRCEHGVFSTLFYNGHWKYFFGKADKTDRVSWILYHVSQKTCIMPWSYQRGIGRRVRILMIVNTDCGLATVLFFWLKQNGWNEMGGNTDEIKRKKAGKDNQFINRIDDVFELSDSIFRKFRRFGYWGNKSKNRTNRRISDEGHRDAGFRNGGRRLDFIGPGSFGNKAAPRLRWQLLQKCRGHP